MFSRIFLICAGLILLTCSCKKPSESAAVTTPSIDYFNSESKADFDARMDWWRDARFGLFIHWGLYAVPAGIYQGDTTNNIGEWIMEHLDIPVKDYEQFATRFNPVKFNAEFWAKTAAEAGMKYLVITSKHHDGFCLWDSKVSDYDIMDASPFKRDILAELKKACDAQGVQLCFYHSIMDWHHPQAQSVFYPNYNRTDTANADFPKYVQEYMKPQLRELLANYDPAVLWFDGEWMGDWTEEQGRDLYNELRNIKPALIINNRVGKGRAGMQGMSKGDQRYAGDFGTPEQEILEGAVDLDWESCMTMNDTWGFKSTDHNWKSAEVLINNLIDCAAKGGNYLLNVGPTAEGEIPAPSVERLQAMGAWMKQNGEAIYASRRNGRPWEEGDGVRYTYHKDGQTAYVICTKPPQGQKLQFTQVTPKAESKILLLGNNQEMPYKANGKTTTLQLPANLTYPLVLKVSI